MNMDVKKKNGLCFLWLALIVFIADIASKFVLLAHFQLYESVPLLSFFSITYIRNYGAAFGFFLGQRWILAIIALTISLFIIRFLYKSQKNDYLNNIGFALVLGGALGNLFDRLYHGFVVDFLDFYLGSWHYPAFNLADSAICIGVILLLYSSFRPTKKAD
ncbi:signal peptidase II [Utexia brackfieldae]|uniref:signal peptidase II n=1 Tax=Utexia brackfieldae TaxID=3074108 RepID=UPI00370DA299